MQYIHSFIHSFIDLKSTVMSAIIPNQRILLHVSININTNIWIVHVPTYILQRLAPASTPAPTDDPTPAPTPGAPTISVPCSYDSIIQLDQRCNDVANDPSNLCVVSDRVLHSPVVCNTYATYRCADSLAPYLLCSAIVMIFFEASFDFQAYYHHLYKKYYSF